MIKNILLQWNPFNIFGTRIEYQDLIHHPLQIDETLRQDSRGCVRRLKVPSQKSSYWEMILYWIQTHLNQRGHLDAIDKLLSSFDAQTVQCSFLASKEFKEIKSNLETLKSLRNGYHFQLAEIKKIDRRLAEIETKASAIFEYSMQKMAKEQEEEREKFFLFLKEEVKLIHAECKEQHQNNLQKIKLLLLASPQHLTKFFQEWVVHMRSRTRKIRMLIEKINLLEINHQGKFTIPLFERHIEEMRKKLKESLELMESETKILIDDLEINYQVNSFKELIKDLLSSIHMYSGDITDNYEQLEGHLLLEIKALKDQLS
jgi:hypothetical protein